MSAERDHLGDDFYEGFRGAIKNVPRHVEVNPARYGRKNLTGNQSLYMRVHDLNSDPLRNVDLTSDSSSLSGLERRVGHGGVGHPTTGEESTGGGGPGRDTQFGAILRNK